jgi:hypothetical protein
MVHRSPDKPYPHPLLYYGMASDIEVRESVARAKRLLRSNGIRCMTTTSDLKAWFETDTPFEDTRLEDIIGNPLIVIHELVEIEEVKKRGLKISKNTIVDNLGEVDEAHLEATKVELMVAGAIGDRAHIESRIPDIERWIVDDTVSTLQKKRYRRLLRDAKEMARTTRTARNDGSGPGQKPLGRQNR